MSYISDFKGAPFSLFGVNGVVTSTDTSIATMVGTRFSSADGRQFVLVQNGAPAIGSGLLVQGPATIGANHIGLAVAAASATGSTSVTVTLGGTLVTANQYQGGFATVSAGQGIGQNLRIASHLAATATANLVLTLEDPLSLNLTTATSKVTLTLNQYGSQYGTNVATSGVIVSPTAASGQLVGVTVGPLAASSSTVPTYGFIQSKGAVEQL